MAEPRKPALGERSALLLLILIAFAWRVAWLEFQSLWRDEVDAIRFASRALPELIRTFAKPGENGPLFFLLLRPWLDIAGQSEFALRLPAAFAGVLAVPLTYALARRLFGQAPSGRVAANLSPANVPLIAALLVAINPYLTWYSQEGKMYALLVALVLGAHLAFLAAVDGGSWWRWLRYLAVLATAALTHVLALLLVPLHAVWLLILGGRYRRRWPAFLLTLFIPALPYFALAGWWQLRLFLSPDFQTGHAPVGWLAAAQGLTVGHSLGIEARPAMWLLVPVLFMLLAGIVMARATPGARAPASQSGQPQTASWRPVAMTLAWLLLPPLLLLAISQRKPLFLDRYVIWIGPAFALLLAAGLRVLWQNWRPLGWAGLLFLTGLGLAGGWRQSHTAIKSDFRGAAAYLAAQADPDDRLLFLIPYSRHTFEYYAGPQSNWADGPYTNNGNAPEQVAAEMARAVGDSPSVWLVASEEWLWDARGLVRGWLDAHGRVTDRVPFRRVELIRYRLTSVPD